MKHFVIREMKPRKLTEGVEIRALSGERMTMAFFHLSPGAGVPEHSHPHEQMGIVLKGFMSFVIGGRELVVREGGVYVIPPNIPHGGRCGDTVTEVIEVFSPVREDMK